MNSLNIISARVSPSTTPAPSRTNSFANALNLSHPSEARRASQGTLSTPEKIEEEEDGPPDLPAVWQAEEVSHKRPTPLENDDDEDESIKDFTWARIPSSIRRLLFLSVNWLFSTLASPFILFWRSFHSADGQFTILSFLSRRGPPSAAEQIVELNRKEAAPAAQATRGPNRTQAISTSSSSALSSESESEKERSDSDGSLDLRAGSRHSRTKSSDDTTPARRSIRIKLNNEGTLRERKTRNHVPSASQSNGSGGISSELAAAQLKSPTSPAASLSLTKYPRVPAPPRPLLPARAPSYTTDPSMHKPSQKTLILDLDETLIHSMAKGGRMSTGHMVEVKLNTVVGVAGQASIGPQHPILYYVHKRPHCDDFLRRVCKWYNLVVFTASVQEYADPVIDWLEQERKFFSGRYYRQHCTYRHGAFIKDLSSVEPDLSKVMILDNSPLSYMFHQDNAIPIEGWISDPTDSDLLHLVPLLEGLQHVTDVRALLALRGGEDGKHMSVS